MNVSEITRRWAEEKKMNFKFFPSIDSTNTECKRVAFQSVSDKFYLCFADHQTHGRGRFDRSWLDHGFGAYLLSSWSFKVTTSPHPLVTARLGLATISSLKKTFQLNSLALKAPNDIYIGGKKVAGLLTESVSQGNQHRMIIGLGLNVGDSPKEQTLATSLLGEGLKIDAKIWNSFLDELWPQYQNIANTPDQSQLNPEEQKNLLEQLNAFSGLTEKYIQISPSGEMTTASKKTSWMDL